MTTTSGWRGGGWGSPLKTLSLFALLHLLPSWGTARPSSTSLPKRDPPRHSVVPYVVGVTSYGGFSEFYGLDVGEVEPVTDGHFLEGDTAFIFVAFSEPITVNQQQTPGGEWVTRGKIPDHPSKAKTEGPFPEVPASSIHPLPTLRLATGRHHEDSAADVEADLVAGGLGEKRRFWKNNAPSPIKTLIPPECRAGGVSNPHLHGPGYCLFPNSEEREDQYMNNVLAFAYKVGSGDAERSFRLDVSDQGALKSNGARIASARDGGVLASLKLPLPGDAAAGTTGWVNSLSFNHPLVIGPPYVMNLTSDSPPGHVHTLHHADGVLAAPGYGKAVPDMVDIKVAYSEPVKVVCKWREGPEPDDHHWCDDITLKLTTTDALYEPLFYGLRVEYEEELGRVLPVDYDSQGPWGRLPRKKPLPPPLRAVNTLEIEGYDVGPLLRDPVINEAGLYKVQSDPPHVVNFRYIVHRGDDTVALNVPYRHAIRAAHGAGILRVHDGVEAGYRCPPPQDRMSLGHRTPTVLRALLADEVPPVFGNEREIGPVIDKFVRKDEL